MKNSVKVERAKKNITQDDLAKGVNVSRQTIVSIESRKYTPSTILALKIARFFDIKIEDIFELEESD